MIAPMHCTFLVIFSRSLRIMVVVPKRGQIKTLWAKLNRVVNNAIIFVVQKVQVASDMPNVKILFVFEICYQ